jgi:hypothetical protein
MGRDKNHFDDTLATLIFMAKMDCKFKVLPIYMEIKNYLAQNYLMEEEMDGKPWYHNIKQFFQY